MGAARTFGLSFPFGTLLVNLAGSFAMGLLTEWGTGSASWTPEARLLLISGVLGGFTTYSAFNFETTVLLREGSGMTALLNVAATVLGCLAAGLAGIVVARLLTGD